MSGSETGVITSREPFAIGGSGIQKTPPPPAPFPAPAQPQPQPQGLQNLRLSYSTDGGAVYRPVVPVSSPPSGEGGGSHMTHPHLHHYNLNNMSSGSDPMKRKRGRPRKYGTDGAMTLAVLTSPVTTPTPLTTPPPPPAPAGGLFSSPPPPPSSSTAFPAPSPVIVPPPPVGEFVSPNSSKKARGRPPGSSKKQQLEALGSAGIGFTPHVIAIEVGEDVLLKIMSFSQNGPRAVCILSASGAISNVTLRHASTSGATATYEGRFDILSLSGSFLLSEVGGQRSRTGGLTISLAGPDGRVLGGCVSGLLTAASPVQVIVGSFIADGRKGSKNNVNQMELLSAPPKVPPSVGVVGGSSPPSHGTLSESSGGPGSPLNQSTGAYDNSNSLGMPWK